MEVKSLAEKGFSLKQKAAVNFHLTADLGINALLVASIFWLCKNGGWIGYSCAQLLSACLYFRAFTLLHDASHSLVHSKKWLNDSMGFLASLFCFLPFWPWRMIHLEHHKWTGHIENDPVLLILKAYPSFSEKKKELFNKVWILWIPYLALQQHIVFWKMGHVYFKKAHRKADKYKSVTSYAIMIGFYGSLVTTFGLSFFIYALPGIVLYLIAVEAINFPHHLSLNTKADAHPTPPIKQFEFCRSCHHSYILSYFFLCNFNYHTEHHMFPFLPWYQLHKLKDDIKANLQNSYNQSDGFQWIQKNRRKDLNTVMYGKKMLEEKSTNSNKIGA